MGHESIWLWDATNSVWCKALCDASGKLLISDLDPFTIEQTTPESLKHVPHGYDYTNAVYRAIAVDANGKQLFTQTNPDISARAYNNADQIATTSVNLAVALNSERFDTDTIHDLVTNNSRLTCKTAGKYLIVAQIEWESNATGNRQGFIRLNGSTYLVKVSFKPATTGEFAQSISTMYSLAISDYVEIIVFQNSGGDLKVLYTAGASPEFSMIKVV